MTGSVFITGTDTEIGKTTVSCAILRRLNRDGQRAVGMKPVAAGTLHDRANADALELRACAPANPAYAATNPWLFDAPTSPDIAASHAGAVITLDEIERAYGACAAVANIVIVEGVGGWRVPLGPGLQTVDMVRRLDLPVILVCGLRLGCINHALLSAETIIADGLDLLGWVANDIDPEYTYAAESLTTLETRMPTPLIGVNAWRGHPEPDNMGPGLGAGIDRLWR